MNLNEKKTIMLVGAGEEHIIAQKVAHSLGLSTFVTDGNPNAPGFKTADYFVVVSTYDYEGMLSAAKNYEKNIDEISGVMTIASDVPFTVAYVAQGLGLRSISLNAARKVSDKMLMKKVLHEAGVPIPLFAEIKSPLDAKMFSKKVGFPFIIKPVDSRGARGVQIVKYERDFNKAFETAKKESPYRRVMVEEYLDGPQLSVEGAMVNGRAFLPAIFDRNYEYLEHFSPFIIENGGEMPSQYSEAFKLEIESVMTKSALALGIDDGVVKGDFVIHNNIIKVIEIAGRLSGGFFGTIATPHSTGVNPVANVMRWSLGEKVDEKDWMPQIERGACIRFAFPPTGVVESIYGLSEVKQNKACLYCGVFVKKGDIVKSMRSHPDRPAVVVAGGKNRLDSISNARRLINQIVIKVKETNQSGAQLAN